MIHAGPGINCPVCAMPEHLSYAMYMAHIHIYEERTMATVAVVHAVADTSIYIYIYQLSSEAEIILL